MKNNSINNKHIFKLWKNINSKNKKKVIFVFFIGLLSSVLEILSIASIYPFLNFLTNSNQADNKFLDFLFVFSAAYDGNPKLFLLILFISLVFSSALFRLFNLWLNGYVAASIGTELSYKIFDSVLHQPLIFHKRNNSSKLITAISRHLDNTVLAINFSLIFITNVLASISIIFILLYLSPSFAPLIIFLFLVSYLLISILLKKRLVGISKKVVKNSNNITKIIQESLGSIRDILIDDLSKFYNSRYLEDDRSLRRAQFMGQFYSGAPKYILEVLGTAVIIYLIGFGLKDFENSDSIAIVGVFTLGAQRLLPIMQVAYTSFSQIKINYSAIGEVLNFLSLESSNYELSYRNNKPEIIKNISASNLSFGYLDKKFAIKDFNFEISKGEIIGIVGHSGSGKSTLLDILMGLLEPTKGNLFVNNLPLYNNENQWRVRSWRRNISHVPQNVYLCDEDIISNIAFGIPKNKVNFKLINKLLEITALKDVVESLPDKLRTNVGEKGVNLSGGQVQRIGIARALYKNPQILFLDEATSALDKETEDLVLNKIINFRKDEMTIILVTHRLSTLKYCNKVFKIQKNKKLTII